MDPPKLTKSEQKVGGVSLRCLYLGLVVYILLVKLSNFRSSRTHAGLHLDHGIAFSSALRRCVESATVRK